MELLIGSHVSFNKDKQLLGCVKETLEYGGNTFMFYTGAPQNTRRGIIHDELTMEAYQLMKEHDMLLEKVVVHAPYIVNLASNKNFDFAITFLQQEIERCNQLGIKKIVLHPGSAVDLPRNIAINNIIRGLNLVLDNNYDIMILLETMAGKGTEVGKTIEEIKEIIDGVKFKDKIGVCLDTCHISDAGYDISDFDKILEEFDEIIGLDKLGCVHINDSKNEKGAHKDRHENIGFGTLGFDNLLKIIYHEKLEGIPKILETPYVTKDDNSKERLYPPYKFEIDMIKKKEFNENLIQDIRNFYEKKL